MDKYSCVEDALAEFRERRLNHEAARKYTIETDDGEILNVGLFRDSMADVEEELADAHNITMIALEKVTSSPDTRRNYRLLSRISGLLTNLEALMIDAYRIREQLPMEMQQDIYEVLGDEKMPKRIVTLEEVGL